MGSDFVCLFRKIFYEGQIWAEKQFFMKNSIMLKLPDEKCSSRWANKIGPHLLSDLFKF